MVVEIENLDTRSDRIGNSSFCIEFMNASASSKDKILDPKFGSRKDYGSNSHMSGDKNNNNNNGQPIETVTVSSIIGSFGWFQFMVLAFSGLREGLVGYDALVTSIILQPESGYICKNNITIPEHADDKTRYHILGAHARGFIHNSNNNASGECFISDSDNNVQIPCHSWLFPKSDPNRASLVTQWSLVCDRSWMVAMIESSFFMGLVVGNLFWGFLADKIGRKKCYLISHTLALISGWSAVFMPNVQLFVLCRFLCALGSIGYNIIYTIQMELIGTKHRSYGTMFNHLGWGLGAISIPFVASLSSSPQVLLAVSPILSLIMFPFAFWLPESSRWLMAHGEFSKAKRELIRAARFNGKSIDLTIEKSISMLNDKIINDKLEYEQSMSINNTTRDKDNDANNIIIDNSNIVSPGMRRIEFKVKGTTDDHDHDINSHRNHNQSERAPCTNNKSSSAFSSYKMLFSKPTLVRDTLVIAYLSFTGHLFYYLQTINFGYMENLSIEANFISSGAGEWFSLIVGAILLKIFSRKTCMSLFLSIMTLSFAFQSLIDSNYVTSFNTPLIVTLNNTIGTLASLLLVFVVLIVNQEVYPTIIRQTGSSIGNTLGETGSTLAPWLIQLNRSFGLWRADIVCSVMCLIGTFFALLVTKTDDMELVDV